MKATGKINPITGDDIFKAEESDIVSFLDKEWEDLSDKEIVTLCSFYDIPFFSSKGEFKND